MKTLNIDNWKDSYKEFNNLFNYIKKKGGSINKIRDTPENLQKIKSNTYKIIKKDKKLYYNLENEGIVKMVYNFQINYINHLFTYFNNLFIDYYDNPKYKTLKDYILQDGQYKIISREIADYKEEVIKYISFLNISKGTVIRICIKPSIIFIEYSKKPFEAFQQIHISIFDKERGFHLTEETMQNYHLLKITELSGLLKNRSKRPVILEDIKVETVIPLEKKSSPISSRLVLPSSQKKSLEGRLGLHYTSPSPVNSPGLQLTSKKRRFLEEDDLTETIEDLEQLQQKASLAFQDMKTAKETYENIKKTHNEIEISKAFKKYSEKLDYVTKINDLVAVNIEKNKMRKKGGKNEQLYQVDNVDDIFDFYVGIKNILFEIKKLSGVPIQGENLELAIEFLNELGNFIKSIIIDNYDEKKVDEIEEIKQLKFDIYA